MKREIFILVLIVLVAVSLRATGVNRALIHDETSFATAAKNLAFVGEPIDLMYPGQDTIRYFDVHPPLGILTYASSVKILGLSSFAYRIVPLIFGILTIVGVYYLGKELFSKRIGLLAAFLMAISRYHILASQRVDLDGGFLAFFNVMLVLFFVRYVNDKANMNLVLSGAFLGLSLFTKLHGFLPVLPLLLYLYLKDKKLSSFKKPLTIFVLFALLSVGMHYTYSIAIDSPRAFTEPYKHLVAHPHVGEQAIGEVVYDKIYYLGIVTWQLTPFLSLLLLLALLRTERDSKFYLIATWILLAFLIYSIPFDGDKQRYISGVLAPIFILVAGYVDRNIIKDAFTKKALTITFFATITLSYFFAVNDMFGYFDYLMLGTVYVAALALLIPKRKTMFLMAAFAGLSIYSILSFSTWPYMQSYAVDTLSNKIGEYGIAREDVWSNKDILFYMMPENTYLKIKFPELEPVFIKDNNVKYIAFHSLTKYNSERMVELSKYCSREDVIEFYGHRTGMFCEIDMNKL